MVYELKPPVGDSPGLLVFTHKERRLIRNAPAVLEERLRRLKERYVTGMHWGSYHEGVGETPFIDFHLACPGTVSFRPDADVRRIPMCSRDFTPAHFRPMEIPNRWDVLSIGHPIRPKKMGELLDAVRMCYDEGHVVDVLLICAIPDQPGRLGSFWESEFFEKYYDLFSESEREHVQLGAPIEADFGDRPLHPIPNEVLPYLYNASSAFTLFSEREGESKVIHEALLCGTPVIVREDLRGGGRDYLDGRNSIQFGSVAEARDAFIAVAERGDDFDFDPTYLREQLCEEHTANALEEAIDAVYADLGMPFEGSIEKEDLALKLPGHVTTLRRGLRGGKTNDLPSTRSMLVYVDELLGQETPVTDALAARGADVAAGVRAGASRSGIGRIFQFVERRTPVPAYSAARKWYKDR